MTGGWSGRMIGNGLCVAACARSHDSDSDEAGSVCSRVALGVSFFHGSEICCDEVCLCRAADLKLWAGCVRQHRWLLVVSSVYIPQRAV